MGVKIHMGDAEASATRAENKAQKRKEAIDNALRALSGHFAFHIDANGEKVPYAVNERREAVRQTEDTHMRRLVVRHLREVAPMGASAMANKIIQSWLDNADASAQPATFAFAEDTPVSADTPLVFKRLTWGPTGGPYPAWEEFLVRLSDREAFMAFVGAIFDPGNIGRQYLWLWGARGQDGKTQVIGTIADVFGEAACAINSALSKEPRFINGHLFGKRLAVFPDCKNTKFGMTEIVRNLTSRDLVPIETKNKNAFSARLECKLVVGSNSKPEFTSGNADKSRCLLIKVAPPAVTEDRAWESSLRTELPGFLHACLVTYARKCPGRGNVELSEVSKALRDEAAAEFEEEYEVRFERRFVQDAHGEVRGVVMDEVLTDEFADRTRRKEFVDWMVLHRGVIRDRDKKGIRYTGVRLAV